MIIPANPGTDYRNWTEKTMETHTFLFHLAQPRGYTHPAFHHTLCSESHQIRQMYNLFLNCIHSPSYVSLSLAATRVQYMSSTTCLQHRCTHTSLHTCVHRSIQCHALTHTVLLSHTYIMHVHAQYVISALLQQLVNSVKDTVITSGN